MYKDIVVSINDAKGANRAIHAAASFANQCNASLTGVYITTISTPVTQPIGPLFDGALTDFLEYAKQVADEAKDNFLQICNALNCSATWYELENRSDLLKILMYSDLVITNQDAYDQDSEHSYHSFINTLIFETGKPVMLIPTEWSQPLIGSRIIVGWDESKEASRAINDAMPMLQQAEYVDVISVDCKEVEGLSNTSKISSYLSKRNVTNQFHLQTTGKDLETPEKVLLSNAKNAEANLIVIGGYGHTRLRELVLGGTTRYLIKHSSVPVLMSH